MTTKHDDMVMDDPNSANSILMSVWDYGGQKVFQVIQHMYMPRMGVYALVFDVTHLLCLCTDPNHNHNLDDMREQKEDALHYLHFWLHSINTHAIEQGEAAAEASREKRCPPVVLVGTHVDSIKGRGDYDELLKKANQILIDEFKGIAWKCCTGF